MTTLIDKPGVYDGIPNRHYHLQLTPTPSMSASMAVEIESSCPRKLWHDCYLNPNFERQQKLDFDLGTAAHLALLEPHDWDNAIAVIEANDYKTNAAQAARRDAYAAGKTPLLPKHVDKITGLRDACLADEDTREFFETGIAEQTVVARDPKTGIWSKARPDKRAPDWSWIADLKTTTSANPIALPNKSDDHGWGQRAEWYFDVVELATGIRPAEFFFIVAEIDAPHIAQVARFKPRLGMKPRSMEIGALLNRHAIDTFAECVRTNTWPKYAKGLVEIDPPVRAEYRLETRIAAGEFETRKPKTVTKTQRELAHEFHRP